MGSAYSDGYKHGRPDGRDPHPLDRAAERAIDRLPMETRLYPDVYAWAVVDAVLKEQHKIRLSFWGRVRLRLTEAVLWLKL